MLTGQMRTARWAVAVLFFTNGFIFANLLPRYPEIKMELDMSDGLYGMAVAAFPAGALTAGLLAAAAVRRFNSASVAVVGTYVAALALWGAGTAGTAALLAIGLFAAGAADAITDVGQNAHGLRVERGYGRSIINSFHAIWSLGAVVGGFMASAALAWDAARSVHLGISTVTAVVLATVAWFGCLPGRDLRPVDGAGSRPERNRFTAKVFGVLAALMVIGVVGAMIEDIANSWAALYLADTVGTSGAVAAFGFIALIGGQFLGRLVGDVMVDRFGQRFVARAGGVLIAVGFLVALAWPTVGTVLAGFLLAGFGMATLIPGVMAAADRIEGLKPSTGLMLITWLMRIGGLVTSPIIGALSEVVGLRTALAIIPVAGLVVVTAAGVLAGRVKT